MVSPLATYLNHFRRKYHNFQLSILNFQFARKCAKQQFIFRKREQRLLLPGFETYSVGWLAASMILTNFSGTREAPPIRPPSMSG